MKPYPKNHTFFNWCTRVRAGVRALIKRKKHIYYTSLLKLLIPFGYYKFKSVDEDGWPHFEEVKKLERLGAKSQKKLMKQAILKYFE